MDQDLPSPPANPCGICEKPFQKRHRYVTCTLCRSQVHIKCNNIEYPIFIKMKKKETSMCKKCSQNLPFSEIRDLGRNIDQEHLASDDMRLFFRSLNDFNQHKNPSKKDSQESEPMIDCKYIDIESFRTYKFEHKSFNILHLNIASLGAHKEELESVLSTLNQEFDVIGISETKIIKDVSPNFDIHLKGYKSFSTPTLASKGGVILYISEKHNCKPRNDLGKIMEKPYML